jgi:hypothetical protein
MESADYNAKMEQLLAEGKQVKLTPVGNSMLPFIHGGVDSVVLRRPVSLRVGDIVMAPYQGRYVLHRIIRFDGDTVVMMGDGILKAKERVGRSTILAKVTEIVKANGKHCKPTRGRLWRLMLPIRRYLLKGMRKWDKVFIKQ